MINRPRRSSEDSLLFEDIGHSNLEH
jgi:hypothetical protein